MCVSIPIPWVPSGFSHFVTSSFQRCEKLVKSKEPLFGPKNSAFRSMAPFVCFRCVLIVTIDHLFVFRVKQYLFSFLVKYFPLFCPIAFVNMPLRKWLGHCENTFTFFSNVSVPIDPYQFQTIVHIYWTFTTLAGQRSFMNIWRTMKTLPRASSHHFLTVVFCIFLDCFPQFLYRPLNWYLYTHMQVRETCTVTRNQT